MSAGAHLSIVGAGPTGVLLAILLRRQGVRVTLYEERPDPRRDGGESGRSINLALADRGIHALKAAQVFGAIERLMMPMRGRLIHRPDGGETFQPYGQRTNEVIYSISRHRLNQALLEEACCDSGIDVKFEHRLEGVDFTAQTAILRDLKSEQILEVPMRPLLASDGAGSVMRRHMSDAHLIDVQESELDHGYKELTIPADAQGGHRLARDALHIWPRGNFMMIALPNIGGSFTASLFLPKRGPVSFDSLDSPAAIERFAAENFPDIRGSMRNFVQEFQTHRMGFLGTVRVQPWSAGAMAALLGDAAHAIVPFHGQGMNCCFEDCVEFAGCWSRHDDAADAFAEFYAARKPNTDAIAGMAIENYLEMRELVADAHFQLRSSLALELERRFPDRFIPRYSMVMFHHEIGYRMAAERGAHQAGILAELTAGASGLQDIDFALAQRLIEARLAPLKGEAVPPAR